MDTTPPVSPAAAVRPLVWIGLVVALLGPILFFAQLRTDIFLVPWYAPILGTVGAAVATWAFLRGRGIGALLVAMILCGLAGFEWFIVLTSKLPTYAGPVAVGKPFPAFKATLADGKEFTEADLRGQPTALVFYRGRWCGICMAELRQLEKAHDEFSKKNVRVVAVSPEGTDKAAESKKAFPSLVVVADPNFSVIKAAGVVHEKAKPGGDDTAMPTTLLIDKDGVVRWIHRPVDIFARLPAKDLLVEVDRNFK